MAPRALRVECRAECMASCTGRSTCWARQRRQRRRRHKCRRPPGDQPSAASIWVFHRIALPLPASAAHQQQRRRCTRACAMLALRPVALAAPARPVVLPGVANSSVRVPPGSAGATRSSGRTAAAPSRTPQRSQRAASASSSSIETASTDYAALQQHSVYSAATGDAVLLPSLWSAEPGRRCVVACLTHFADLSSTELAQKLVAVLPEVRASGVVAASHVLAVCRAAVRPPAPHPPRRRALPATARS